MRGVRDADVEQVTVVDTVEGAVEALCAPWSGPVVFACPEMADAAVEAGLARRAP